MLMLRQIQPIGPLRDPVVIASFVQGNGINSTAAATLAHLVQRHGAEAVAEFEPHQYFDFSARRPMVRVEEGLRVIDWPQNRIHLLKGKDTGRDALILSGIEPHLRWREFSESIAGLVPGGATVIIARSLPGAVPHTRHIFAWGLMVLPEGEGTDLLYWLSFRFPLFASFPICKLAS